MTEEASFVAHIRANPHDVVPRLVYADFLEERGDPRGEFIRIQCELADGEAGDPRRPELMARERQLLEDHAEGWLAPLRALGATGISARCFRRGLIERVRIEAEQLLAHAEPLCAAAPALSAIELRGAAHSAARLADLRLPPQIGCLDLSANGITRDHVALLTGAAWAPQLDELHLTFNALGDAGARTLSSRRWNRLRVLAVGRNEIGAEGAASIAALSELRTLAMPLNPIGAEGAANLARSRRLSHLADLDLAAAELGDAGLAALMEAAGGWPSLRRLNLRANGIGESALRGLAAACPWNLTYLDVRANAGESARRELESRFRDVVIL